MDYPSDPDVGLVGGKFSDGDPVGGVPASRDPASWANGITDELLAILTGLGVTPVEEDNGQIIDALLAFFAPIVGSAAQVFRVATAVGATDATPLAQVQALVAAAFSQSYVGTYTRDISVVGSQTLTGCPFTPKLAFVFTAGNSSPAMSVGVGKAGSGGCIDSTSATSVGTFNYQTTPIFLLTASGSYAAASFSEFNSGGGVLSWSKTGTPTGTFGLTVLFIG